jgi:uncharacterized protein YneF (UPF0154 family)
MRETVEVVIVVACLLLLGVAAGAYLAIGGRP